MKKRYERSFVVKVRITAVVDEESVNEIVPMESAKIRLLEKINDALIAPMHEDITVEIVDSDDGVTYGIEDDK